MHAAAGELINFVRVLLKLINVISPPVALSTSAAPLINNFLSFKLYILALINLAIF